MDSRKIALLPITLLILSGFSIVFLITVNEVRASPYVTFESDIIKIGNNHIELQFTIDNVSQRFYQSGLINKSNEVNYISGYQNFLFYFGVSDILDIKQGTSTDIHYLRCDVIEETSDKVIVDLVYENVSRNLIFHTKIEIRSGECFVSQRVGLEYNLSGTLDFWKDSTAKTRIFTLPLNKTGVALKKMKVTIDTTTYPEVVMHSPESANVNSEHSNAILITAGYDSWSHGVTVLFPFLPGGNSYRAYTNNVETWQQIAQWIYLGEIKSSESVMWLPPITYGLWESDWEASVYNFMCGRREYNTPIIYNTWAEQDNLKEGGTSQGVITNSYIQMSANGLSGTNMDNYLVDYGWQTDLDLGVGSGNWINKSSFNITEAKSDIESNGMSMGFWFAPVRCTWSADREMYNANYRATDTNWMSLAEDGYYDMLLNTSDSVGPNPIDRMIDDYGAKSLKVDFYRTDHMDDSSPYGYSWSSAAVTRSYKNFYNMVEYICETYPDTWLLIDLTEDVNCPFDLNMLSSFTNISHQMMNLGGSDTYSSPQGDADMSALSNFDAAFNILPCSPFGYSTFIGTTDHEAEVATQMLLGGATWCQNTSQLTTSQKSYMSWIYGIYHNISNGCDIANLISPPNYNITFSQKGNSNNYVILELNYNSNTATVYDHSGTYEDGSLQIYLINSQGNNTVLQDNNRTFICNIVSGATNYSLRVSNYSDFHAEIFLQLDNISEGCALEGMPGGDYFENSTHWTFVLPYAYNVSYLGYHYYQVKAFTSGGG